MRLRSSQAESEDRTRDLKITNLVLYQLSYLGTKMSCLQKRSIAEPSSNFAHLSPQHELSPHSYVLTKDIAMNIPATDLVRQNLHRAEKQLKKFRDWAEIIGANHQNRHTTH